MEKQEKQTSITFYLTEQLKKEFQETLEKKEPHQNMSSKLKEMIFNYTKE